MRRLALGAVILAALLTGVAVGYVVKTPRATRTMALWGVPVVPAVKGYVEGQQIRFIHTEASDPEVAQLLTRMMNSPVLVMPSLAEVPESALAAVYVFTNGVKGEGPFDFQPDVFDHPPDSPGYRPLRAVHLVRWNDPRQARLLTSVREVKAAEQAGEITAERSGVVVNMPFITWPGGSR
jgi:hypothetical protein